MNSLPKELYGKFDFCWSVCVVEHLGSIANGLSFLENSLKLLKPGGVSIHTTEFNYLDTKYTIDNGGVVAYKKEHFESLAIKIEELGAVPMNLNFTVDNGFFDKYIDLPPFAWQNISGLQYSVHGFHSLQDAVHLRLWFEGLPITNIGLIIKKPL